MKIERIEYLSPSGIRLWREKPERFYLRYIAKKLPYGSQTKQMAYGSGFDSMVKGKLNDLLGRPNNWKELYAESVEEQNRTEPILNRTLEAFGEYLEALNYLVAEIRENAVLSSVKMEQEIQGKVGLVTLKGIPDLDYQRKDGLIAIHDWKVNGLDSRTTTSPEPGYVRLLPGGKQHKDAPKMPWFEQLMIYAWLLGKPVGVPCHLSVDQIVGPKIRVASFRMLSDRDQELRLYKEIVKIWEIINSDHIFRELSHKDSLTLEDGLMNMDPLHAMMI